MYLIKNNYKQMFLLLTKVISNKLISNFYRAGSQSLYSITVKCCKWIIKICGKHHLKVSKLNVPIHANIMQHTACNDNITNAAHTVKQFSTTLCKGSPPTFEQTIHNFNQVAGSTNAGIEAFLGLSGWVTEPGQQPWLERVAHVT